MLLLLQLLLLQPQLPGLLVQVLVLLARSSASAIVDKRLSCWSFLAASTMRAVFTLEVTMKFEYLGTEGGVLQLSRSAFG